MNKTRVSIIISIRNKPPIEDYNLFKHFPGLMPHYDGFYPLENPSYMFEGNGMASFAQNTKDGIVARLGYTGKNWGHEVADMAVKLLMADGWELNPKGKG